MNNNFYFEGDNRGVILLHSYTSGPQDVQSLARFLNKEGYTVYTPCLSGHGTAVDLRAILDYSYEDWREDVAKALSFMEDKGHKNVALFGLSLGGILSLNTLINDDRILAGGAFSSSLALGDLMGVKQFFMASHQKQAKEKGEAIMSFETVSSSLDRIFKDVYETNAKSMEKLKDFKKPIFLAQGGKDEIVDADDIVRFRNSLFRNQIHFYWYDDAPHVITIGSVGLQLREDLLAFLNTLVW